MFGPLKGPSGLECYVLLIFFHASSNLLSLLKETMMKILTGLFTLAFSMSVFAVQTVECTPGQNPNIKLVINFSRNIDPAKPFIGTYDWGASLKVIHPVASKNYENKKLRITPEVYYSDISLRGDAEGVYLRMYPHFDEQGLFLNYTGQLFVNDLDVRAYFNFTDRDGVTGFICQ